MNRIIKFKIWDTEEKNFFNPDALDTRTIQRGFCDLFNNERYVPQQFTGLIDSTGKEIYEGDILQINSDESGKYKVVVEFQNGMFTFGGGINMFQDIIDNEGFDSEKNVSKIIGNIFENPDLIK